MKYKTALSLSLFIAVFTLPALAQDDIIGSGRAVDGDTLKVGPTVVRLFGIDAMELKQTCTSGKGKVQHCGDLARQMLNTLIQNVRIRCKPKGQDKDGALVAVCYAGPFDINEQMVSSGWALPLEQESDTYVRAQKFASARKEGVWRGTFITPEQWRAENGVD